MNHGYRGCTCTVITPIINMTMTALNHHTVVIIIIMVIIHHTVSWFAIRGDETIFYINNQCAARKCEIGSRNRQEFDATYASWGALEVQRYHNWFLVLLCECISITLSLIITDHLKSPEQNRNVFQSESILSATCRWTPEISIGIHPGHLTDNANVDRIWYHLLSCWACALHFVGGKWSSVLIKWWSRWVGSSTWSKWRNPWQEEF